MQAVWKKTRPATVCLQTWIIGTCRWAGKPYSRRPGTGRYVHFPDRKNKLPRAIEENIIPLIPKSHRSGTGHRVSEAVPKAAESEERGTRQMEKRSPPLLEGSFNISGAAPSAAVGCEVGPAGEWA